MAGKEHRYAVTVTWTGNTGTGTSGYRAYERRHEIAVPASAKPAIPGSSDPAFRGDPARWNPEELLVASLSACHKLWYLHLCADAGLAVTAYTDRADGVMEETADGGGRFRHVTLRPEVTLAPGSDPERARAIHHDAHEKCFIAASVNFTVAIEPVVAVEAG
ncbi:OsmC family protein [Azospirillum sp. SYSU D00513]|uniref:OsmC family protein n=1 Tax=Azospirillum sp. SYSU D00513 TaxID=2812561 RepID=UPI001A95FEA3|nr:OsmC family protein [Azospirillum sp. SYSU D00513]